MVADRIRAEFLKRIGLEDLLAPHAGSEWHPLASLP